MTDQQRRDLSRLVKAYMHLLQLSHHEMSRTRMQSVLASLVHEIAHVTGSPAETVQSTIEYVAMMMFDGEVSV